MGKYTHITKNLPKYKGTGNEIQDQRIEECARRIESEEGFVRHASALALNYAHLRTMKDILDHLKTSLELRVQAMAMLSIDQLENEGSLSLGLTEGVSFEAAQSDLIDEIVAIKSTDMRYPEQPLVRIESQPYGKINDKDAFRHWCIKNDLGDKLQLWPSSTQRIVKELLEHAQPMPDGIEATAKYKLVLVKGD